MTKRKAGKSESTETERGEIDKDSKMKPGRDSERDKKKKYIYLA